MLQVQFPQPSLSANAPASHHYTLATNPGFPHPAPANLHEASLPSSSRTRFDGGLASPVSSYVGDGGEDMTSYYGQSYNSSSSSTDNVPYQMSRSGMRYDSNPYPLPSYPVTLHSSRPASKAPSRVASPEFQSNPSYDQKRGGSNAAIHPYLQLPPTISSNGGSLTEFAAQATCLFWFESSYTLARLEDPSYSPPPRSSIVASSVPTTGFLKWVTTILSTTQVTQNVVLLALLFIRRLKNQNPTVKGKPGSEYRLLTVALMLGNKFLDDNTYTNKTWAEVSGISVGEIHVMEVEFLSHMKYNLYTTKEEWERWHKQLASLWRFFNTRVEIPSPQAKVPTGRPILQIPRALPSPPGSTNASSPYAGSLSPALPPYSTTPQSLPYLAPPPVQAPSMQAVPSLDLSFHPRKRSWDESAQMSSAEPPLKRPFGYDSYVSRTSTPTNSAASMPQATFPHLPSLPMPNLPVSMSQSMQQASYASPLAPVSASRSSTQALPGFNWPTTGSSLSHRTSQSSIHVSSQSFTDRMPHSGTAYDAITNRPSPASNFSSAAAHTSSQHQMSPSFFLHQRSSPYRPVRDIRTLLGPAHSGQLQSKPTSIPQDQMHWQPLGRHNERQSGRVPYLHRDAWPDTFQWDGWSTLQTPNLD